MAEPQLPPDLERVGDDLVAGVERTLAAKRRRRRLLAHSALTGVAALAAAAVFIPAGLGPGSASRAVPTATADALVAVHLPAVCDLPLGGRLSAPACSADHDPVPLGRPGRW